MLTKVDKLKNLASHIKATQEHLDELKRQWDEIAESCKFHAPATDLNCNHPDESYDPVCECYNCPIVDSGTDFSRAAQNSIKRGYYESIT